MNGWPGNGDKSNSPKIKGVTKPGSLNANGLISAEDAKKIRKDVHIGGALKRSKVIIVTDPLIGGIESRLPFQDALLAAASY